MTPDDVLVLLSSFEKRLDAVSAQAKKTLDMTGKLRHDLTEIKNRILATTETQQHPTPKQSQEE